MITICLLTYERTDYAIRTIRAAQQMTCQEGFAWYVADDGSRPEHFNAVLNELHFFGASIIGAHSERSSYGAIANKAWKAANEVSDLTFWLEDDWELREPMDLTPYADLLRDEEQHVGMVRLGYLNLNMQGKVFSHGGHLYWRLNRDADPYVFAGHPSLRNMKFYEAYGDYPTNINPGDTELGYAFQYRNHAGPDIVWPAQLGEASAFGHIGTIKSYTPE
jgi:hypothetical protein